MMNHLAWMISRGRANITIYSDGAQKDWNETTRISWEEKTEDLLR